MPKSGECGVWSHLDMPHILLLRLEVESRRTEATLALERVHRLIEAS